MKKPYPSIRLFKSDFLENLSKVHPVTPLVIFLPVLAYMVQRAWGLISVIQFIGHAALGLIFWTFFEYSLHRFLFHLKPFGPISDRLLYLFHGVHHDDPHDPLRLVMPPSVSIPLATLLYFTFVAAFSPGLAQAFYFGFIFGYLIYDMSHYAFHHFQFQNSFYKYLRKYHYIHHFSDAERGFGVSSPLWDYVFGSTFLKESKKSKEETAAQIS